MRSSPLCIDRPAGAFFCGEGGTVQHVVNRSLTNVVEKQGIRKEGSITKISAVVLGIKAVFAVWKWEKRRGIMLLRHYCCCYCPVFRNMFVTLHAICMAGISSLLRVIRDFRQGKTRLFPDGAEREYVLPV